MYVARCRSSLADVNNCLSVVFQFYLCSLYFMLIYFVFNSYCIYNLFRHLVEIITTCMKVKVNFVTWVLCPCNEID